MNLPLGYRNNNPTNLRYRMEWGWPGVVGIDDKQFAKFSGPDYGIAAWIRQMRRYAKRGLRAFVEIVPVYAPASENNVAAYIAALERQTGIPANQPLNLDDKQQTITVARAFIRHELGMPPPDWPDREWYDEAVYLRAWEMAKPLSKSRTVAGAVTGGAVIVAEAVQEVALEVAQQGAAVGEVVEPWMPGWGKWVLMAVGLAGFGLAVYARWTRTRGGD